MNSQLLSKLPPVGVYTLIIHLSRDVCLKAGKLGGRKLSRGYYAYTGSAMGHGASGLPKRVARHLKKNKRRFWHIDYLLAREDAVVTVIIAAHTNRKAECETNRYLREKGNAEPAVSGFGASDCRENCGSHLLYFGERNIEQKIASLYNQKFGNKTVRVDLQTKISNPSSPKS